VAFPNALRAAISGSGRSLESLRRRLQERGTPLSIATLSYWQSGRSAPQRASSLLALANLEAILGLAPEQLSATLGPPRRPGPPRAARQAARLPVELVGACEALESLGFTPFLEVVDVTVHATLEVDAQGSERLRTVRNVVRATRDGARRLPVLLTVPRRSDDQIEVSAISGGRLGRVVSLPRDGVFVAELVLDRTLRGGETAAVEYEVRLPNNLSTDHSMEHHLWHRVSEIMLWVRFHPDRLPRSVQGYSVVEGTRAGCAMTLDAATSVQQVLHRAGPGTVGVSWAW
jgi:hypothetical protein